MSKYNSPEWMDMRNDVLQDADYTCPCGRIARHVHHISYHPEIVEALCGRCHMRKHGIRPRPRGFKQ